MNTTQKVTLLGLFGLVGYALFAKAKAAGTINFYPANVKRIQFDGATPVMTIGLAAQNTSNEKFILKSIAGNMYAGKYLVGNLSSFVSQTIQPNSATILELQVRLSLIGIVNDIIRDFQQGNFSQTLTLDANANVDNLQVPIKITYKIGA